MPARTLLRWPLAPLAIVALLAGMLVARALGTGSAGPIDVMAVDCDAVTDGIQSACKIDAPATFQVEIHLTDIAGPYAGLQTKLRWTLGVLEYKPTAAPIAEIVWPECGFAARTINPGGPPNDPAGTQSVQNSCAVGTNAPPSSYTGVVVRITLRCAAVGSTGLTLVPRPGDTQLGTHVLGEDLSERDPILTNATVTCNAIGPTTTPSPSPTPTRTPTPCPPEGCADKVAVDCDAMQAGIQNTCKIDAAATFQVEIDLSDLAAPYSGFQTKLRWADTILAYKATAGAATEIAWPDCRSVARVINPGGPPNDPAGSQSVQNGCSTGIASSYTGVMVRLAFRCGSVGTTDLTLVPRPGDTQLGTHILGEDLSERDPVLTNATVECSATQTPTPTPDPNTLDSDSDGCSDAEEMGDNPMLGGQRDRYSEWDFFDTPIHDGNITIGDIFQVIARFGGRAGPPPVGGYHIAYDRTVLGPMSWNLGPPNGSVTIQDIVLVVAQFGHSCQGPA